MRAERKSQYRTSSLPPGNGWKGWDTCEIPVNSCFSLHSLPKALELETLWPSLPPSTQPGQAGKRRSLTRFKQPFSLRGLANSGLCQDQAPKGACLSRLPIPEPATALRAEGVAEAFLGLLQLASPSSNIYLLNCKSHPLFAALQPPHSPELFPSWEP